MDFLERIGTEFQGRVSLHSTSSPDAVDGVLPCGVVEPHDEESAQQLVAWCGANKVAFVVKGGGTKLSIGAKPACCDVVISTAKLAMVHEHDVGNATVEVGAGIALDVLEATVATNGQFVPLDWQRGSGASLGGVVAANHFGATKLHYSAPRDLVTGMHVALSDGRVVKAGGKVVKNVSGYDLNKIFIGSYGTLGLITRVTIRLRPAVAVRRYWQRQCASWDEAQATAYEILNGAFEPTLLRVVASAQDSTLLVLASFDGGEDAVTSQIARLPHGTSDRVDTENFTSTGALTLRANVPLIRARKWAENAISQGATQVQWDCGLGAVQAQFEKIPSSPESIVRELRACAESFEGSMIVTQAPFELKNADFVWGKPNGAFALHRQLKNTFDASLVCSPGRFMGGL